MIVGQVALYIQLAARTDFKAEHLAVWLAGRSSCPMTMAVPFQASRVLAWEVTAPIQVDSCGRDSQAGRRISIFTVSLLDKASHCMQICDQ